MIVRRGDEMLLRRSRGDYHMKRYIVILAVLLIGALPLLAQDETPRVEVFGGYSYVNADFQDLGGRRSLNGWNGQANINVNRWLGITGDFGGYYGSTGKIVPTDDSSVSASFHDFSFSFGPTLTYRQPHYAPFFHALFGGNHVSLSALGMSTSNTAFALALGGGLDIPLKPRFGLRLAQVDWVRTQNCFPQIFLVCEGVQNNLRVSTGVMFNFGKVGK